MSSFTCPVDGATLVPVERQGIEIDHCPTCRGVWLDRGELDKLIERSAAAPVQSAPPPQIDEPYRERRHQDDRRHYDDNRHYPQKRKRSFLEDLFD
jgi:Zn-finger nucleic acid-binding protein